MRTLAFIVPLLVVSFSSLAFGQGMWMPQQVPQLADQLEAKGLELDPAQFADLTGFPMGAVVSTGGCSASFVSPQGLIATNHHCVAGYLQFNSTPQRDLLNDGFLARSLSEEIQASPDARIFVTTAIEDVTSSILSRISPKLSDLERANLIEKRRKEMIRDCEKPGGLRCRVDAFFAGSEYLKTTQIEIRDVRLVYAPPAGVGNYGGETDNWMWPRHTGDFGFLRAYVGPDGKAADPAPANVPYRPKHWLKISTGDLDPGDLVLVAGYPGETFRYETAQETRMKIEFSIPQSIAYRKALMAILERENERGREVAIRNASRIRSLANYLKKYEGTLAAFERGRIADVRAEEEARMSSLVSNDEELLRRHESVMGELRRTFAQQQKTEKRDTVLYWLYYSSPMLTQADQLYQLSRQRAKRDLDREEEFQERNWPKIEARIARVQRQIEPASDRAGLAYFLKEAAALPADQRIDAVDQMLAATGETGVGAQIEALLDRIYANTKMAEQAFREDLFDDSTKELLGRNDAMITLAAVLRPRKDANERAEKERKGAFSRLRPDTMGALRAVRGSLLAPDANGTLRITFGTVAGYEPRDGVAYTPFTTVEGILEKETGEGEFDSPDRLLDLVRGESFGSYTDPDLGTVPVNFLSTTDITNGNSGSAVLNGKGELIGLAFDGNYEAMGSDYLFDEQLQRTISVDSRYMLWVMDAVDDADHLLREMGIQPQM